MRFTLAASSFLHHQGFPEIRFFCLIDSSHIFVMVQYIKMDAG
ncbi:hypothetical protein HMPREF9412_2328 [Paenibacillus sp. HGF5]|nr:hypothetical protein HMPREF9412_2328 [Paenibacillus sp. HGF5]